MELDRIDKRILAELQGNARISNQELADKVGLSPSPCLRRVRALEDSGLINGYYTQLNASMLVLKLMAEGNKYAAGVTSLGDRDVRIIIREIFQDPRNYGKVSFPTAAKSTDLRPYTKGTLVREEMELEEDLEDDEEDEEIEDLDRVLPPESTTEEAFEEEQDELDES